MRYRRGFSLIELLMVIAIIGIIATIAIPLMLRSRRDALDEKARQSLRNVVSAQVAYHSSHGSFGTLSELAGANPPFLDTRFSSGVGLLENGMTVECIVGPGGQSFTATVLNPGGGHDYTTNDSGLIEALPH